jgi:ubiquinone/menaquinone biosynthesis C-methylase UbiE
MANPDRDDEMFMGQFRCPTGVQGRTVASLMNRAHNMLTNWALSHVKIEQTFVVLDIGCGGGRTINKMANHTVKGKAFGIDYSKDMIKYSKEKNRQHIKKGQIHLLQASVEKMSFFDNFFDLVTAIETYYFWDNLPDSLHEVNRVLKPGGTLLIVNEMIKDGKYEKDNAQTIAKAHVHLVTLKEFQQLLKSAGFINVEFFRKTKSPWNVLLAKKA